MCKKVQDGPFIIVGVLSTRNPKLLKLGLLKIMDVLISRG